MNKVAIYARRSEEKDTGESIQNQLKICRQYISNKYSNLIIDEFYDDDYSGRNMNRPQFTKMMKLVRAGVYDCLVFWKLDRVARNTLDFLNLHKELEAIGVNLISVTEGFDPSTASGKLMMTILASVAEMERKNISIRVSTAAIESAKKGKWNGGKPPLGYKLEKKTELGKEISYIVPVEEELQIVIDMFDTYITNNSLHAVRRMLLDKYSITKTITDIRRLLSNVVYVKSSEKLFEWFKTKDMNVFGEPNGLGLISYGKKDYTGDTGNYKLRKQSDWVISVGAHEAIIDDYTFMKVNDMIHVKTPGRIGTGENTFLNPLVRCFHCGSYMRTKAKTYKNTKGEPVKYSYFVCNNYDINGANSCRNKSVKIKDVENQLIEKLTSYCLDDEFMKENVPKRDMKKEIKSLKDTIDKKNKQISNLVRKMALTDNLEDIFESEIKKLKKEIDESTYKLNELEKEEILNFSESINRQSIIDTLKNFETLMAECNTIESKRALIRSIVKHVYVDSSTNEITLELCL